MTTMKNTRNMRNMRKRLAAALTAAALAAMNLLSGCTEAPVRELAEGQVLYEAVVIAPTDQSFKMNLALIQNDFYLACRSYGGVTLVVDDGNPYYDAKNIPVQPNGYSAAKYNSIATRKAKQLLAAADQMRAKTPESNTLAAIQLAARDLQSHADEGSNVLLRLIVMSPGLPTTGVLDFTKTSLRASPEKVVQQLRAVNEIPDLTNIEVDCYFTGDVTGRQPELGYANRSNLRAIWQGIYEAGGAASVSFHDDLPLSEGYEENLPKVTPVPIDRDSIEVDDVGSVLESGSVLSFGEESIAFEPGTAQLKNVSQARESLSGIVNYLKDYPSQEILVVGTTAGVQRRRKYCLKLSRDRANAIRAQIIQQGIEEERIRTAGVGFESVFYVYDNKPDGSLDETIAPLNRTVKVLLADSATAKKIKGGR